MLYGLDWAEGGSGELELHEDPDCCEVFATFMKCLYTGEAIVNVETALPLLRLADKYQVESLKSLIVTYMTKQAQSPNVNNALTWLPWARVLQLNDLMAVCSKTFAWNVEMVMDEPAWKDMDVDVLVDFLSSSDLVVENELKVYKAVCNWLNENRTSQAEKLLPLVRFSQMHVHHLQEVEKSDMAVYSNTRELMYGLLSDAYRYRTLCPAGVTFEGSSYTPRHYVEAAVDSVKVHNTRRFGLASDVKTWRGSVPSEERNLEWKVTYRRAVDRVIDSSLNWVVHVLAHDDITAELALIMQDQNDRVLDVQKEPVTTLARGQSVTLSVILPKAAHTLALLIKPMF